MLRELREEALRLGCTALVNRIDELISEVESEAKHRHKHSAKPRHFANNIDNAIEARINGIDEICLPRDLARP